MLSVFNVCSIRACTRVYALIGADRRVYAPIGAQCECCFMLTLKQAPRKHQNAPLPDKKSKHFLGRGHSSLPRPLPHWGGEYPLPTPHPTRCLRRLDYRAFGAQRSRSFSFTTRTLTLCSVRKTSQKGTDQLVRFHVKLSLSV